MECSQTSSHSALVPSTTPPDYSWTDAELVDLAQICRDLGISEEASASPETLWEVKTAIPASPNQATSCPSKSTKLRLKRKATTKPIKGRINAPRRSHGQFQKMNDPIAENSANACASQMSSVGATWKSSPLETLQTPKTSNFTNPFSSNIALMIYSTFIEQHLNSDSKNQSSLELQLRKNIFLKFYQPHLISFIDSALAREQTLFIKHSILSFYLLSVFSGLIKLFTFI